MWRQAMPHCPVVPLSTGQQTAPWPGTCVHVISYVFVGKHTLSVCVCGCVCVRLSRFPLGQICLHFLRPLGCPLIISFWNVCRIRDARRKTFLSLTYGAKPVTLLNLSEQGATGNWELASGKWQLVTGKWQLVRRGSFNKLTKRYEAEPLNSSTWFACGARRSSSRPNWKGEVTPWRPRRT